MTALATGLREHVRDAAPGTFWRIADVAGPPGAVHTAFHRLVADGSLVRVRRGLYWKGVSSRYGAGKPSLIETALAAAGPGAGPAGRSAAHALTLSSQIPAQPEVAVIGRAPAGIPDVRFHRRSNLARLESTPTEIALIEALRDWPTTTEKDWHGLVDTVRLGLERGTIDLDRVTATTSREPSPKARELLDRLTHQLSTRGT